MPINWLAQAQQVDDLCDEQWGERVRIVPQSQPDEYSAGTADPDRPAEEVVGIFERPEAGTSNTAGGNRAQSDFTLSVQDRNLPDYELRDGDKVEFLDAERAGTWMQIAWLDPGATGRTLIHLLAP